MKRLVLPCLIVAAVAAAFLPVLSAGFFWDDEFYVEKNFAIRGLDEAAWRAILTQPLVGHWHPLTVLSFALDHALWGLTPAGYHLTNLLIHLANVVLLAGLLRSLGCGRRGAWAGALLWGIHPLRVEPVVCVSTFGRDGQPTSGRFSPR